MKSLVAAILTIILPAVSYATLADTSTVIVNGQTAGPRPFINKLSLTAFPANALKSVKFTISPKAGSVTRAVSATY